MSLTHIFVVSSSWFCLSVLTLVPCLAQIPVLERLAIEKGSVIGATFDSPHDRLYVEHVAVLPSSAVMEMRRKVLIFSLSGLKQLGERVVESKSGATIFPPTCNAIAADASGSSITICLDDRIAVLETSGLAIVRSFRLPANTVARGMALDEKRSEVMVLLGPDHQTPPEAATHISVAILDWKTGAIKSTQTIATVSVVSTAMLAYDSSSGMMAVGVVTNARGSRVTRLFSCTDSDARLCLEKATVGPIGSMAISGSKLLLGPAAGPGLQPCIPEIDLRTGGISHRYCGARYPVKEAVALAAGGHALAFTGSSRYNPFSENTTNIQSSLTLWCGDDTHSPNEISYPVNKGLGQGLVKIVGDQAAAEFATFTLQDDGPLILIRVRSAPKSSCPK